LWQADYGAVIKVDFAANLRSAARTMFSHIVIFWAKPDKPEATEELIAGAKKYLQPIPGIRGFHVGRMAPSHRGVVDQTYQAALNLTFDTKQAQDDYQVHPLHTEFVEKVFKPNCDRVVVYDFE
jgi:hypothetical protein